MFLDTTMIESSSNLGANDVEARIALQLTTSLLATGVTPSQIGVITPYSHQVKRIIETFQEASIDGGINVLTVDRSQGQERDCIIVSMAQSHLDKSDGSILNDWRRLNVCLTRAKLKLVVIGSQESLRAIPSTRSFIELLNSQGQVLKLTSDVVGLHTRDRLDCDTHKRSPPSPIGNVRNAGEPSRATKRAKGDSGERYFVSDILGSSE